MTEPCDDCTRSRAGLWCGYRASCPDCTARAIARSLPAFNALHRRGTGDPQDLREAIQRAMLHTEYSAARRMVWAWSQHDQATRQTPAGTSSPPARARLPTQKASP